MSSTINYIKPGEPVSASVANRPVRELDNQLGLLSRTVKTASLGETLILKEVTADTAVEVGMPVYWDSEVSMFRPAKADIRQNCDTGEYESGSCADCVGLVYAKHAASTIDVVLSGVVDLPQIRNFLTDGSGRFFLGLSAGSLTFTPAALQVPVGILIGQPGPCDERVQVYVNPEYAGKLFGHHHHSHVLRTDLWKPVSADAPPNTFYYYDVSSDAALARVFPPIPTTACSFTIDWKGQSVSGTLAETLGGRYLPPGEVAEVTCDGIWWTSEELNPTYEGTQITLHFSRIDYENAKAYVTSLKPAENQPFLLTDCSGEEASTGDLSLHFTLEQRNRDAELLLGTCIQAVSSDWYLENTPVVHGVRSLNSNLRIIGGAAFERDGQSYQAGLVSLACSPYSVDYEVSPTIVKLSEALEKTYYDIQYLALPYNRSASSLTWKMYVPSSFGENLHIKMRFLFLAQIAGLFPDLNLTCIRLPRPVSEAVSVHAYKSPFSVECTTQLSVTSDTLFEVESAEVSVANGDTLIWTLSRTSTAYASDVGIVRAVGILNAGGTE